MRLLTLKTLSNMKKSYLFLAAGFEEIEALATTDILRRGGMEVVTVSITDNHQVAGANGITAVADRLFSELAFDDAEWLICPGGMPGSTNLAEFEPLCALLKNHAKMGKIAAICAAPAVVLYPLGILDGLTATCYPGFEDACPEINWTGERVEAHERVITANGPSSAFPFALAILANSMGEEVANQVGTGTLYLQ